MFFVLKFTAVQNERDRISCRRPSYDETNQNNGLSVTSLLNAEMLSRQVGAYLEVCKKIIKSTLEREREKIYFNYNILNGVL